MNESNNYLGASNWWSQGRQTSATGARVKTVAPPTAIPTDAATLVEAGVADAGGSTTTMVDAARTEVDDFWNGKTIRFTNGPNVGLLRLITDFVDATNTTTFHPAVPNAVGAGDTYDIVSSSLLNRIVVTGYHLAGTNTNPAACDVLIRHATNTANVVLDFFVPATNGGIVVANSNIWIPLEAGDSLESAVIGPLTGIIAWTFWGRMYPASTPVAMKYAGDATNP